MAKHMWCHLLACCVLTTIVASAVAHEDKLNAVELSAARGYWPAPGLSRQSELIVACGPIDVKRPLGHAIVSGLIRDKEDNGYRFRVVFPKLSIGDLFPLVRAIYQVEALAPGKLEEYSTARMKCQRVNPPADCALTDGAVAFPFISAKERGLNNTAIFRGREFFAEQIAPEKDAGPAAVAVDVLEPRAPTQYEWVRQVVRVGDFLELGKHSHRLVKIVQPDPRAKVVGWFELELEPHSVKK